MPTETIIVLSLILFAFATFGGALAWVDRYARGYRALSLTGPALKPGCVKAGGPGCGSTQCASKGAAQVHLVDTTNATLVPANSEQDAPVAVRA